MSLCALAPWRDKFSWSRSVQLFKGKRLIGAQVGGEKIRRIAKNWYSLALVLFTEMKYGGLRRKFLSFDARAPALPGLSLRTSPHGRTGRCQGLARGAPHYSPGMQIAENYYILLRM